MQRGAALKPCVSEPPPHMHRVSTGSSRRANGIIVLNLTGVVPGIRTVQIPATENPSTDIDMISTSGYCYMDTFFKKIIMFGHVRATANFFLRSL
eukprot:SAG31_NODE_1221_length_9295_cov_20.520335_7_plen_95_part_00